MWIETIEPEWPLVNSDRIVAIRMAEIEEEGDPLPELWAVYGYCKTDHEDDEWAFELFKGTRTEAKGYLMTLQRALASGGAQAAKR